MKGSNVAEMLAEFVREKHITQVIFGHSATNGLRRYLFLSAVHRFLLRCSLSGRSHREAAARLMHTRPHILVVDDEPQITRVLRTSLDAQGYEIRVANDGETALEIVKDFHPRPGDYRPRHAAHEWHRVVPAVAEDVAGSDHRALGSGRGAQQGRGARLRCRRLRHQAVRQRRTAGPNSRRVAALASHRQCHADADRTRATFASTSMRIRSRSPARK